MTPNFALELSLDSIALKRRTDAGWTQVGSVALTDPAFDSRLAALREEAGAGAPGGVAAEVVIPASEILFTAVPAPSGDDPEAEVRAALDGMTPYAVDDLVIDWAPDGAVARVAVVARSTLKEAEAFARSHGFEPAGFAAVASTGDFPRRPSFATPDRTAIFTPRRRLHLTTQSETAAPTAPEAPPPGGSAPQASGFASQRAPDGAAPPRRPDMAARLDAVKSRIAMVAPAGEGPVSAPAASGAPAAADPLPDLPAPRGAQRLTVANLAIVEPEPEAVPAPAPADADAPDAPELPGAPDASALSEAPETAVPAPSPARGRFRVLSRANLPEAPSAPEPAVAAAAGAAPLEDGFAAGFQAPPRAPSGEGLTLFGTRDEERDPQRLFPLFVGIGVLLVAAIGIWLVYFMLAPDQEQIALPAVEPQVPLAAAGEDGEPVATVSEAARLPRPVARPDRPATTTITAATPIGTDPAPAEAPSGDTAALLGLPVPGAETGGSAPAPAEAPQALARPDAETGTAPAAAPGGTEDLALVDPGTLIDDSPPAALAPQAPEPTTPVVVPRPLTPAEAEARYARTGIWQIAPSAPSEPGSDRVDTLYTASVDPRITGRTLTPLAPEGGGLDSRFDAPLPPPPAGTRFELDERGLVRATPEGALSPEGILVTRGTPRILPPRRPGAPAPEVRPRARPATETAPQPAPLPPVAEGPAADPAAAAEPPAPAPLPEVAEAPRPDPAAPGAETPAAPLPAVADAPLANPATPAPGGTGESAGTTAAVAPGLAQPALPDVRPRARPVNEAEPTIRPRPRPGGRDDASAAPEPAVPGGTDAAVRLAVAAPADAAGASLAGIVPRARPGTEDADAAAAAAAPPTPAGPEEPQPGAVDGATELAVATSALPRARPAKLASRTEERRPAVASLPSETRAPNIPTRASVARRATESDVLNLHRINLVGVYGSTEDRRALVRLKSGKYVKLKVGDRLDGGRVAAIGDDRLIYSKGARSLTLQMPSG